LYQFFHLFYKRTGIADWIAVLNARGKNDCVSTSFHKFPRPQNSFFPGTSSAVDEAYNFNIFFNAPKGTLLLFNKLDKLEIGRSRTIVLSLHTSEDSYFNYNYPLFTYHLSHQKQIIFLHISNLTTQPWKI
jgi:hypothetical protein